MTVVIEGTNSFFLTDRAYLVEEDRELAWAEKYVVPNPAHRWVLGKFVEAENANQNRHFWTLNDLQMSRPTIAHAPMNLLHQHRNIVGAFVATDFIYPTEEEATSFHPYIEALGVFWKYYFPDELKVVEAAYADGSLFYSMECIAKSVTCAGDLGCGKEYEYAGPVSDTYCNCINQGPGIKQLNQPHFTGGALVVPPARPGLKTAHVTELAELGHVFKDSLEVAEADLREETRHMTDAKFADLWTALMETIVSADRDFPEAKRKQMAKKGTAMPDGSFPIANEGDLHNAIKLAGQSKNPEAARSHIKKRAKALGLSNLIPDTW